MKKIIRIVVMTLLGSLLLPPVLRAQELSRDELEKAVSAMKQAGAPPEVIENFRKSVKIKSVPSAGSHAGDGLFSEWRVPQKAEGRIRSVPAKIFSDAELKAHIRVIVQRLEAWINEEDRKMLQAIYDLPEAQNSDNLASIASSFWICANYHTALLLMGKATLWKPDADNLNNFAAFLLMEGGQELALPILLRLNHDYPKNSTVLNNIGQAWLGLGDLERAQKYLDSATYIMSSHPQANLAKAVIAESKGQTDQAIQLLRKSIKEAYSSDKESGLEKLGYRLTDADVTNNLHAPEDALGLEKWLAEMPDWPMNVEEVLRFAPVWKDYLGKIEAEEASLRLEQNKLNSQWQEMLSQSTSRLSPIASDHRPVNLGPKASLLQRLYASDRDGSKSYQANSDTYNGEWWTQKLTEQLQLLSEKKLSVEEKYLNDDAAKCRANMELHNAFIRTMNEAGRKYFTALLTSRKKKISDQAYFGSYTAGNNLQAQMAVLGAKIEFLNLLSTSLTPTVILDDGLPATICIAARHPGNPYGKLRDFDDINCKYKVDFTMPGIGSWGFYCNKSVFNLSPLFLPFKLSFEQNLNTNEFKTASISISQGIGEIKASYDFDNQQGAVEVGAGISKGNLGPAQLSLNASARIEFDRNGISDVSAGLRAGAGAGNKLGGVQVNSTARISWNAGPSVTLNGGISGMAVSIMQHH